MCGREGVVSFVSCLFRDGRATAAVMQVQQRGPGYECVCVRVCACVCSGGGRKAFTFYY